MAQGIILGRTPAATVGRVVVAPRMPRPPKARTGDPFKDLGDITAECQTCLEKGDRRYHVAGARDAVKKALDEHHRLYHADEIGVILLNTPHQ